MRMLMRIFFVSVVAVAAAADDVTEINIEKVIGPERPGKYKHPAAITQLDNGDLYIAYYGGGGEYKDASCVWGMRKVPGAGAWSEPEVIADTPFLGEGNGVVWQAPDGLVWLFYVQRYGETWSQSRTKAKVSRDGARTWSDSIVVGWELGTMCRGRPIVLEDGDYLLPVYHETGGDRERMDATTASYFLRHDPEARTWKPTNKITSPRGNLQPEPVQITGDYLVAYCRVGGDYLPRNDRYLIRSESRDGGHTWSAGEESQFPNPNAAVSFLRLENGHLLLVYNDSMNRRTPLAAAISTDNDKTYPYRRVIAEGDNTFAYPMAIQADDGRIHVVYTTDDRQTVMHAVFEEEAVLQGGG